VRESASLLKTLERLERGFPLLYLLLKAERDRAKIARICLASVLALVLLSSVVPFSALASRGCKMACCVARLSHEAESCSVGFASENKEEASDTLSEEDSAHHHTQQGSAHRSSSEESSQTASIAYEVMTYACSPECACCAASASTQLPRPRETVLMSGAIRTRPPMLVIFDESRSKLLLPSTDLRRQTRPRAPPSLLINTPA